MASKIVLYPILVPAGKYCWEWEGAHGICGHFNGEAVSCRLGFPNLVEIKNGRGVEKSKQCLELKERGDVANGK